ncbi:hypothetical protein EGW08_001796 [Elysia chlorotica]|uniref:Rho-GAP domain-containing protein n=1 Tax=Elysia chlorotica TaxID=188477 RepID=A0A3S1BSH2_ELYCH|nr:hypothetical protein EGW08_001796 [Elysia chlorotica]
MDGRGKSRNKVTKRPSGFFKAIHRLPSKFIRDCGFIPIVLINTAKLVEKYIKTKEIFQTQGTRSKAYSTLTHLSSGKRVQINKSLTVHDAVEAMKLVLINLPEPLVPEDVCDSLITASRENSADQYGSILRKFRMKSPLNFGILHFMMILLKKVSLHAEHNLMDVRKLATIFVLDVIKPLKLDDPNDGNFLSERMQRLPYLIMVIEKLILNVDIFKNARVTKTGTSQSYSSNGLTLSDIMLTSGAGSGDSKPPVAEGVGLNLDIYDHCVQMDVSPASRSRAAQKNKSASSSSVNKAEQSSIDTLQEALSPVQQQSSISQISKSGAPFGKCSRYQKARGLEGSSYGMSSAAAGTTRADSHTALGSSSVRPPPFCGLSSKVPVPTNLPLRRPKSRSASSTTSKFTGSKPCMSSCALREVHSSPKASPPNARNLLSFHKVKIAFPKGNVKLDGNYISDGKEKRQNRGRSSKAKTESWSLPPFSRYGRASSGYGARNYSPERKGSSPKKKAIMIKGRVGSFRYDRSDMPRPVMKRRSTSAGVLETRTQPNRFASLGRRRRKGSASRKRSAEVDKRGTMQDEVISPWNDEGLTSDDVSLMDRTIRNPRILPVPDSSPSSPETALLTPLPSRRSRSRERRSRRSFFKSARVSPYPSLPSLHRTISSEHEEEPQLEKQERTSPLVSNERDTGDMPGVPEKPDSPERSSNIKSASISGLVHPQPMKDDSASPSTYKAVVIANTQKEKEEKVGSLGLKSLERLDSCEPKDICENTAKDFLPPAAANDLISSISCHEESKDESGHKETCLVEECTPFRSVLKPMIKHAVENERPDQDEYSSLEFVSPSSSHVISEGSSKAKPAHPKESVLQRHNEPLKRVNIHNFRHFRLQNETKWQKPSVKGKSSRCRSVFKLMCSSSLAVAFIGLYFYHYLKMSKAGPF